MFNLEISMYLCYIDGSYILHVIDIGTRYSAAKFLSNEELSTDDIWNDLLSCWILVYSGMLDIIRSATKESNSFPRNGKHCLQRME